MKKIATFKNKTIANMFIQVIPQSVVVKIRHNKEIISILTKYAGFKKNANMKRLFG